MEVAQGTSIELFWEYPSGVIIRRDRTWSDADRTPADSPRFDHTVVISRDFDASLAVYTDTLDLPVQSAAPGLSRAWTGMDGGPHAWIRANEHNNWIALMSPSSPNDNRLIRDPSLGHGAILELAAEVADIDAFAKRMAGLGIVMTAGDGAPLPPGATAVTVPGTGDRYAYFSRDQSEGMRIMVFQRGPASTSVFAARDR